MSTTTAVAANKTDRKAILRDKRAQGIAAMGLVNREGDRFLVTTPTLRGKRASYEVWRDVGGKIRCTCLEFEEQSADDQAFRCEHILAVKHSLRQKTSEPVTKQATDQPTSSFVASAMKDERARHEATTQQQSQSTAQPETLTETASEKQTEADATAIVTTTNVANAPARFGRKQSEPVMQSNMSVQLLAEHTEEEDTMRKQNNTLAAQMREEHEGFNNEGFDNEAEQPMNDEQITEQPRANVLPMQFTNTLRQLRQPVEPSLVKTREGWTDRNGNKHMVEYVEWHTVADTLDRVSPTWSHAVKSITQIGDMVAVTCAITIDGVTREGVGTGTADNETGIKKAEHDALKRAAIKFGLARDLYQRESEVIERNGATANYDNGGSFNSSNFSGGGNEFPREPLAKSMADLVTPKQLGMIRALAREAGVDMDEECQTVMRCRTEELSKRAASSLIDHLKSKGTADAASGGMRRAS